MELSDLFFMLDMEEPEEFEYFEQLADLIECEEDIPYELIYSVLEGAPKDTLAELTGHYFKELSDSVPRENEELIELAETITQRLQLLCEDLEDEQNLREYADEIDRFRRWYHQPDGALVDGEPCSIMDAVAEHRAERLGGRKHDYDFPGALRYELRELTLSLGRFEKIDLLDQENEGQDP